MECRYCKAWNSDDDHRCRRCGRRLRPSIARAAPDIYPTIQTATAPSLAEFYEPALDSADAPVEAPRAPERQRVIYQRPLFQEMPRVMPAPAGGLQSSQRRPARTAKPARRTPENQQALDFDEAPAPRTLRTSVEAVIYCDARVAHPTHRLLAAALDGSLVLTAMGVLLLTFHMAGGEILMDKQTLPLLGGIAAVLWLFYHILFCLGAGDTAGMRWTRLQLVNFDGRRPNREQRLQRVVMGCLSVVSAFLGVIWALVDEENLTWHDHISKTFPTVRSES